MGLLTFKTTISTKEVDWKNQVSSQDLIQYTLIIHEQSFIVLILKVVALINLNSWYNPDNLDLSNFCFRQF